MAISINRNVPPKHRLPKTDGSGGGEPTDCPYIGPYNNNGIGIFDPDVDADDAMLYAEHAKSGSTKIGINLRAMFANLLATVRRPFVKMQRYTIDHSGGAYMKLQPPAQDDSVADGAYIELTDNHAAKNGSSAYVGVKYYDTDGDMQMSYIQMYNGFLIIDQGMPNKAIKIGKDYLRIGNTSSQPWYGPHVCFNPDGSVGIGAHSGCRINFDPTTQKVEITANGGVWVNGQQIGT